MPISIEKLKSLRINYSVSTMSFAPRMTMESHGKILFYRNMSATSKDYSLTSRSFVPETLNRQMKCSGLRMRYEACRVGKNYREVSLRITLIGYRPATLKFVRFSLPNRTPTHSKRREVDSTGRS